MTWGEDPIQGGWGNDPLSGAPGAAAPTPSVSPGEHPIDTSIPLSIRISRNGGMPEKFALSSGMVERVTDPERTALWAADPEISTQDARMSVALSSGLGLGAETVHDNLQGFKLSVERDKIYEKLQGLPVLSRYMSQSPQHARAVADEIDQWSTLEKIFGRRQSYATDDRLSEQENDDLFKALNLPENSPERQRVLARSYTVPAPWLLAMGRATWATAYSMKNWALASLGPTLDPEGKGPDLQKMIGERQFTSMAVPGDKDPLWGKINAIAEMGPLVGAAMIPGAGPALGLGVMYASTHGRVYEDLRMQGYSSHDAYEVGALVGYTTASIAAALGPMFKLSGKLVPDMALRYVSELPSILPDNLQFAKLLGKNFAANMAMNVAMGSSEASIKEAFDSAKKNRPFNYSVVWDNTKAASNAWAEMMALSVVPAYEEAKAHKLSSIKPEMPQEVRDRIKLTNAVYENYENAGMELRSMHAASEIIAAVASIKDLQFVKDNPEEARKLVQMMVAPRETQSVFVDPKLLLSLSDESRALLGDPDPSTMHAGEGVGVPVSLIDFLMHPEVETIMPGVAGEEDLLPIRQALRADPFSAESALELHRNVREILASNPDTPKSMLDQYDEIISKAEAQAQVEARAQAVRDQNEREQGGRQRAPSPVRPEQEAAPRSPVPPESVAALRGWAEDVVSKRPTGELQAMLDQHGRLAEQAQIAAMEAQVSATEHALGDRQPEAQQAQAEALRQQRAANINDALTKAVRKQIEAVQKMGEGIASLASEPAAGPSARDLAWQADAKYGEAFDAILEGLGVSPKRGYAAPDLSDAFHKMARERKLSGEQMEGWDLRMTNRWLRDPKGIAQLTSAELGEVYKALQQISQAADAENSVRAFGTRVAKNMILQDIATHLKTLPDTPPGQRIAGDSALTNRQKVGEGIALAKAALNAPHTLFFKMGKVGEDLWFERFVPGLAREEAIWGDMAPQLKKIRDSMPKDVLESGDDVIKPPKGVDAKKWGERKRSDVWHLMLHMGGEGADLKLAAGLGLTLDDLHGWVRQNLGKTPEHADIVMKQLIEPHWKMFDGLWDEYQRHFKERGLAPPEKVRPLKVTVNGKEYSGGYGGRLQWFDSGGKEILHPGSLEALLEHDTTSPAVDSRQLIERTGKGGLPLLNWESVETSLRKEIHDIALRGFVEDAHKIFSDDRIRGLLADKMTKQAVNEIYDPNDQGKSSFLHVVARGSVADIHTARVFTRGVMKLQGLAAYSVFSMNFRVIAGQLSHLGAAMPGLGILPDHMTTGMISSMSMDRRAWAHAASQVLRLRYSDYESRAVELNRQMTGMEPGEGSIRETTDHVNWAAWREMDAYLSHSIWEAAYAKATGKWRMREGMNHDEAVRFADKAVTMMMPAQDIYDQAAFVRDRSLAGFSFLVRNFPNTLANVAALNWWEARRSGKTLSKTGAAAKFVGMVMAAEVGKAVIMQGGPGEKEDPAQYWAESAFSALFYPYMLAEPALGVAHALVGDLAGVRRNVERMTPPALSMLGGGMTDLGRLVQDNDTEGAFHSGAHLLGLLTKSPLPMKAYDLSNAARNADSASSAFRMGMGYRK